MKRLSFLVWCLAALLPAALSAAEQGADELLKKYGCVGCHARDAQLAGPSYVAIAARYRGKAGAAVQLAAKVKKSGPAVWGPVPHPPNAALPDADVATMVRAILAH